MPTISENEGSIEVTQEDTILARYLPDGETKPYFETLALPAGSGRYAGRNLIADSPHDHVWHHGAWFVQKMVDGLNCWESELAAADGRPHGLGIHRDHTVTTSDSTVTIDHQLDWEASYGDPLLTDNRSITLYSPGDDQDNYFLRWEEELTAVETTRTLHSESYHGRYGGLSFRLSREMTGGDIRLPKHENPDPNDPVSGPWCDFSSQLDGAPRLGEIEQAGITIFDHPDNDRPSHYFTRREPFPLLTANPIWHDVVILDPGESLSAEWGLWIHRGRPTETELEDAYTTYLELE